MKKKEEERSLERVSRAALEEQELRYHLVADAANDAIWDWDLVTNEIMWNEGLRTRFGYTSEEIISDASWWMERIHPEDSERVLEEVHECIEAGPDLWSGEYRFRRSDRSYAAVYDRGRVVRDATGKGVRMVGSMLDLTEKRMAEQELQLTRERLDFVLRSSGIGFWYCDLPFTTLEWDAQTKVHFHLPLNAEVTMDLFVSRLHPDDREATLEAVSKSVEEGVPYDVSYRTINPLDGSVKWIRAIGRKYEVPGGERFDGMTIDISEQKRAEEALKEIDRRKTEFLATLAHELRNPLAPLKTGVELIRRSSGGMERTVEMMERQLNHMVRLIDDLLDVSRISSGKITLRTEKVELRSVIDTAIDTSRSLLEGQKHTLTVSIPDTPIYVEGDQTRLSQILGNLLNNAAKYTPEGGSVTLKVEVDKGNVAISVIDSGIGIPRELQDHVFDMFTQVDKTLERAKGGLGIGLALVKRLVELHGGDISVQSEPGKGSTFKVVLPVVHQAAAVEEHNENTDVLSSPRKRVLIVDDNQDGAEALSMFVTLLGHDVRISHDGRDALDAAREFSPELVFLDIGLPGLDGFQVARAFRDDPKLQATYLVAVTGWGSADDKRKTREAGFDVHLTKPVDTEIVEQLLSEK